MGRVFKTHYRLEKEGKIIGYKIYSGIYIYFVKADIYKKGIVEGLLEEDKRVKIYEWQDALNIKGKVVEQRIEYAIDHTTLEVLREAVLRTEQEADRVRINYRVNDKIEWSAILNIKEMVIEEYKRVGRDKGNIDYVNVLDYICSCLDRTFMNSGNILEKIESYKNHGCSLEIERQINNKI